MNLSSRQDSWALDGRRMKNNYGGRQSSINSGGVVGKRVHVTPTDARHSQSMPLSTHPRLTLASPLLTLAHTALPIKQPCSPFRTERDFVHVRIQVKQLAVVIPIHTCSRSLAALQCLTNRHLVSELRIFLAYNPYNFSVTVVSCCNQETLILCSLFLQG